LNSITVNPLINQTNLILKTIGAAPIKDLGQNFLICEEVLDQIVETSELKKGDQVFEIGPGLGFLSDRLLKKEVKLLAIEKDPKYCGYLRENFKSYQKKDQFKVFSKNFLTLNLNQFITTHFPGKPLNYKIVANIPYNITSKFFYIVFENNLRPSLITVLVQKEVAQKITAKAPNNNPLALLIQYLGEPEIIDYVDKTCFYPEPKVDSAILQIKNINSTLDLNQKENKDLFWLIKIGFASPRKTLINNLKANPSIDNDQAQKALADLGIDVKTRAQELRLEDWVGLDAISRRNP
jgi:16S rRNA (adenine1518-N6/adenine1519-N6)-dimethyltransferase